MNVFAQLALLLYLPAGLSLYLILPPRRATLVALIGGWLFLPVFGFELPGLPDYTKISSIALVLIIGTLATEPRRLATLRPRWFDLPMAIWCVAPFFASLSNDLGVYDGLSESLTQTVLWGVPWLIGRAWFSDAEGMQELATGLFVGGLIYVPFCWYEIRMSPQLHNMIYGEPPSSFIHVGRFGGYRPIVFMRSGLELGMWMTATTLTGLWLWWSGTVRQLFGLPVLPLLIVLGATTILCKSLGALLLLLAGIGILCSVRWTRLAVPALVLAAMIPGYMLVRSNAGWTGETIVNAAAMISERRAQSLEFRLEQEDMLVERALERPIIGWAGWGRSRVRDDEGEDISVTDGLWIIALGQYGIVGLSALTLSALLPILLLRWRCPVKWWRGPPTVLALIVLLFMADSLLNAMPNPIYVVVGAAVCGMPAAVMRAIGSGRVSGDINPQPAPPAQPRPAVRPARPGGAIRPFYPPPVHRDRATWH